MILRRVVANFRGQEWTAVAIEPVVVVGVFIGVQGSASSREHLRAIAEDKL